VDGTGTGRVRVSGGRADAQHPSRASWSRWPCSSPATDTGGLCGCGIYCAVLSGSWPSVGPITFTDHFWSWSEEPSYPDGPHRGTVCASHGSDLAPEDLEPTPHRCW